MVVDIDDENDTCRLDKSMRRLEETVIVTSESYLRIPEKSNLQFPD